MRTGLMLHQIYRQFKMIKLDMSGKAFGVPDP